MLEAFHHGTEQHGAGGATRWLRTEDGTKPLLQHLAASPLVRKSLPSHLPAVLCLSPRSARIHGKFLVRETLVDEEFVEALIRLHEEKLGLSQADRDFGLPSTKEELWEDHWRWLEDSWDEGWGEEW